MNKFIKNKKGFTLVELIVAIAVFLVVMAGLTPLLVNTSRYMNHITSNIAYQNASTNIINSIRTNVSNSNSVRIINELSEDGALVSGFGRYYTKGDYSAFGYEIGSDFREIVSSSDLKGRKIKVDFECSKSTGGMKDTRLAMLFVTVSVYDSKTDLSFFNAHPDCFNYYDYDYGFLDADSDGLADIDSGDDTDWGSVKRIKEYKDASGTVLTPPEPVFQQRSGIYITNVSGDIEVPVSRKSILKDAVENGDLDIVYNYVESGYDSDGNLIKEPVYFKDLADDWSDPSTGTPKEQLEKNCYNTTLELIENDDQVRWDNPDLHIYAGDGIDLLRSKDLDYTGTVLKFYNTIE